MNEIPKNYAPPADLLKGATILVTGAGAGLGRATALACAQHGATVVLVGKTVAKLEKVYDEIKAGGGAEPAIYPVNLGGATWKDYEDLAATLEREFGKLDGLAHCAAHFKGFGPLLDADARDWIETLQVNLTAPFALTKLCLPLLDKSGAASIVFVSDDAGRRGKAYHGAYGVSKFGVEGLMQTLAQELESAGRVRVNSLDPGPMDTALRRKGYDETVRGRDPALAANALLWLLGRDSAGVSGGALSLR